MLDRTTPSALAGVVPGAIEFAKSTAVTLSDWMRDRATLVDDYSARRAKEMLDRAKATFGELEDERDRLVRPHNEEVARINATYKAIHNTDPKHPGSLDKIVNVLKGRLDAFMAREEEKRLAKIEEARRIAQEAAQAILDAQQRQTEALMDEAEQGVVDTDFGLLEEETDRAISQAAIKCRDLARAEHSKVRLGGGFGRVLTRRNKEVLTVTDWQAAIAHMSEPDGVPPEIIIEAVLRAARSFRTAMGELPAGITQIFERRL